MTESDEGSKTQGDFVKRRPDCAEEIQDAARVCKHCGRDVPAPPPEATTVQTDAGVGSSTPAAQETPFGDRRRDRPGHRDRHVLPRHAGAGEEADDDHGPAAHIALCVGRLDRVPATLEMTPR